MVYILIVLLLTFIQGFFSAPSTTDSMVYHLPRIMYWLQDQTVYQQVIRNPHDFMPPFGEYILIHLYSFTNSDRLLFLSQWLSFLLVIILSFIVSEQIGNKKISKIISLSVATIPMIVFQAVSTQLDLISAMFLILSMHFVLLLIKDLSFKNIFFLALSIGLGLLTKPTFIIYALIPGGIILLNLYKRFYSDLAKFILGGLIVLIFQLSFWHQNLILYGSILGKHIEGGSEVKYINEFVTLPSVISNLIKNLFIELPIPVFSPFIQSIIENLHAFLGISLNDPRLNWGGYLFSVKNVIYPQEDIVSSPLQLLLAIFAVILLLYPKLRNKANFLNKQLLVLSIVSFILFSSVLKWQPFHPRLHLPILIISTIASIPIIAAFKYGTQILRISVAISSILALVLIFLNVSRPYAPYDLFYKQISSYAPINSAIPEPFFIKPRDEQYFNARPYWYRPYSAVVAYLAKTDEKHTLAFDLMDNFEYPIWVLLKEDSISTQVISKDNLKKEDLLISTSKDIKQIVGFNKLFCSETDILYGTICLYEKTD